jgi:hypothetical protein
MTLAERLFPIRFCLWMMTMLFCEVMAATIERKGSDVVAAARVTPGLEADHDRELRRPDR